MVFKLHGKRRYGAERMKGEGERVAVAIIQKYGRNGVLI